MPGQFVTLEGGEGAGKSTQAKLLAEALEARGRTVHLTREPGGTAAAEMLRTLLLDPAASWCGEAEVLLHIAARAEHVAQLIGPALARGETVVCDRFADSTLAYQGFGQGVDPAMILAVGRAAVPLTPALTFVLDIAEPAGRARVAKRSGRPLDRYERLGPAFSDRVRRAYRAIAMAEPRRCVLIDASGGIGAVHAAMLAAYDTRFSR